MIHFTKISTPTFSNDESKFKSSYSNYVGRALGGRIQGGNNPIYIGSVPLDAGINGTMTHALSNITTSAIAYRVFPGAVDDIRVYDRQLSDDEIAYLAAHPDVNGNLAPYVGEMGGSMTMSAGSARAFAPETADDGKPSSGALAYEWEVLSGVAANVAFADKNAAATRVTVAKPGTYSFRLKATDGERVTYGRTIVCEVLQSGTMIILK